MAHKIVVTSRKGGVGKSTIAMQISIALHLKNKKVTLLDCDSPQNTLTTYISNRARSGLSSPQCTPVSNDIASYLKQHEDDDFIIIDTSGGISQLANTAHEMANTILLAFNDSFIDLDVLAKVTDPARNLFAPNNLAEDLWETRKHAVQNHLKQKLALVLNRAGQNSKNRAKIVSVIETMSKQWGIHYGGLIKERVGYRDGFLHGRTPLDPQPQGLTASHVAARQEIRRLVQLVAA